MGGSYNKQRQFYLFFAEPSVVVASNFGRSLKRQTQLMNLAQVSPCDNIIYGTCV